MNGGTCAQYQLRYDANNGNYRSKIARRYQTRSDARQKIKCMQHSPVSRGPAYGMVDQRDLSALSRTLVSVSPPDRLEFADPAHPSYEEFVHGRLATMVIDSFAPGRAANGKTTRLTPNGEIALLRPRRGARGISFPCYYSPRQQEAAAAVLGGRRRHRFCIVGRLFFYSVSWSDL